MKFDDLAAYWAALTLWTSTHPATTTLILVPVAAAIFNWLTKEYSKEELARMWRPLAWLIFVFKFFGPHLRPIFQAVLAQLLRQPYVFPTGTESTPPPPLPKQDVVITEKPEGDA